MVGSSLFINGPSANDLQIEWTTHQAFPIFIVDARFLCCIANSFKKCRLASIGPSDDEDTEMTVFLSKFLIGLSAGHCGWEHVGGTSARGTKLMADF